jgi:crotonobetainyl-CoA:carnitine CoA-transferase CaiB-like acyl-CoA transferase
MCGSDGKYFAVSMPTNTFFKRFVEVTLDRPGLYTDHRSGGFPLVESQANRELLNAQIITTLASHPSAHWAGAVPSRGYPLCSS